MKTIKELFTGKQIEFHTQYSLEDCQHILESASKRKNNSLLYVQTNKINQSRLNFAMLESDVLLKGIIQEVESGVDVYANITLFIHFSVFIFFLLPVLCTYSLSFIIGTIPSLLLVLIVFFSLIIIILLAEIQRMNKKIYDLLGKSKKKKRI